MTSTQAANADTAQGPFYVDAEAAEAFGRRLLVAHGLPEEDAAIVARGLVRADLRGVGANAFLVGESLMRQPDVERATRTLLGG